MFAFGIFLAMALASDSSQPKDHGATQTVKASQAEKNEAVETANGKVICRHQRETGSRLASKRVCMTEAQWANTTRDQRQEVEKIQAQDWKNPNGL